MDTRSNVNTVKKLLWRAAPGPQTPSDTFHRIRYEEEKQQNATCGPIKRGQKATDDSGGGNEKVDIGILQLVQEEHETSRSSEATMDITNRGGGGVVEEVGWEVWRRCG